MKHGKKYRDAYSKVDRLKNYEVDEALNLLQTLKFSKFDESVDVSVNLGVDPKYADQMLRGAIVLPHGTGRKSRILVFAKGDKASEAEAAGADYVGAEDYVEKIQGGWLEFDSVIATPDMMKVISKLGKILGTRGMMPNPKVGTVTIEVGRAVKEHKAGRVEYRTEKNGIIHASIGRVSFEKAKLVDNFKAFVAEMVRIKPSSAKGVYLRGITLSTTMGPGVKVDTANAQALLK
ncbi:MAG: 50S ribosomal protein L1 [Oligoflexia bacterium]|nr:50S ribosomal protein L1 [Oligoflexia bacterium]